jgi:hypothetical protein
VARSCKDTTFLRTPPHRSVVPCSTNIRPPSTYRRINGHLSTVHHPHAAPMDAAQSLSLTAHRPATSLTVHIRGSLSRSIFHPFFPLFISLRVQRVVRFAADVDVKRLEDLIEAISQTGPVLFNLTRGKDFFEREEGRHVHCRGG